MTILPPSSPTKKNLGDLKQQPFLFTYDSADWLGREEG